MKKRKDPFSKGNSDYDTLVNQLYNQVNAHLVAWGISAAIAAAILALLTAWNTLWAISKEKTTSNSKDRKNTSLARKALTAYLRHFVQTMIYRNTAMTDADIIACGLDPYDRVKSPVGKPATQPDMDFKYSGPHQVSGYYKQSPAAPGVSGRGKPEGVGRVKIAYFIGENPPADPSQFPRLIDGTRTPVKILFDAADAGKKVTFAGCWVSTSNINGDWTGVTAMVVP